MSSETILTLESIAPKRPSMSLDDFVMLSMDAVLWRSFHIEKAKAALPPIKITKNKTAEKIINRSFSFIEAIYCLRKVVAILIKTGR